MRSLAEAIPVTDAGPPLSPSLVLPQAGLHFAGVNLGRGHVKVKTDAGFFQYASLVQRAVPDLGGAGLLRADTQRVELDGVIYDVGEEAALSGERTLDKTVFSHWGTSPLYRVLMQSILDRLARESAGPWAIMLGLPVAEYKDAGYREGLTEHWRGRHRTASGDLWVNPVATTPEPLGSFWQFVFSDAEHQRAVADELILIVDFGYFTTCISAVDRMRLKSKLAGSTTIGTRDVFRVAAEAVQLRYRKLCTDLQIEMAVLGKWPLRVRGEALAVEPIVAEAVEMVAERLMAWIQAAVDRSDGLVLATGGGAHLFTEALQAALPEARVQRIARPQEANAYGYWHMAQTLADVR